MKFRRTCSSCNATFFSPDRKASLCLKCSKKRIVKHIPASAVPTTEVKTAVVPARVAPRPVTRPGAVPVRKDKGPHPPKVSMMTPELRQKIIDAFNDAGGSATHLRELHGQIAEKLWVKRRLVADVLKEITQTQKELTPELKTRAIEMYKRFVENGHRPDGGRRRAISAALNLPYKQVMSLIRDWSLAEYAKSPTPNPSRVQLFEIEKLYWKELHEERFRLTEMPDRIAEQLGYVTRWQVLRWLDVLHDDEHAFDSVPDPSPDVQDQILTAYKGYLDLDEPPEHGLHFTIAGQLQKVTPRQVHKVLQAYRHKRRAEYPLI